MEPIVGAATAPAAPHEPHRTERQAKPSQAGSFSVNCSSMAI